MPNFAYPVLFLGGKGERVPIFANGVYTSLPDAGHVPVVAVARIHLPEASTFRRVQHVRYTDQPQILFVFS